MSRQPPTKKSSRKEQTVVECFWFVPQEVRIDDGSVLRFTGRFLYGCEALCKLEVRTLLTDQGQVIFLVGYGLGPGYAHQVIARNKLAKAAKRGKFARLLWGSAYDCLYGRMRGLFPDDEAGQMLAAQTCMRTLDRLKL